MSKLLVSLLLLLGLAHAQEKICIHCVWDGNRYAAHVVSLGYVSCSGKGAMYACVPSQIRYAPPTVVELNRDDADDAQLLHQHLIEAQKRWDDFQKMVATKYLLLDKGDADAGVSSYVAPDCEEDCTLRYIRKGFGDTPSFIFSDDYKYILAPVR